MRPTTRRGPVLSGLLWCSLVAVLAAAAGCRGAPPPLPPVPPSSGPLLLPPPAVPTDEALVDRVVAVVNDDVIMMSELQEAVLLYRRESGESSSASGTLREVQWEVLQRMVDHRLQVQEARREGLTVSDEELKGALDEFIDRNGGDREEVEAQLSAQGLTWDTVRRELRDQLLAQQIRGRRVGRRANVTEEEVDAFVAQNREKLEADLKYRPRHIAILAESPGQPADWERARAAVEALRARLEDDADFAALAREQSQDPSAPAGGDLGWLVRGELQPLFEEAIMKLEAGEVTPPIKSPVGYHLFTLEEREQLTPEMLDAFRQQARELLVQRKARERLEEWVEGLRQRALISIRL